MRALTLLSLVVLVVVACGGAAKPNSSGTPVAQSVLPSSPGAPTADPTVGAQPTVSQSATMSLTGSATPVLTASPAVSSPVASTPGVSALDARFQGPHGLALDDFGNLYVTECEWTWAVIDKVDPNGIVTRFAGTGSPGFAGDGGPATDAQLYCPAGIAVGPDGAIYFADHLNNRIRRVDANGVISTFAGSGPAGLGRGSFSGDGGPATLATLQEPWGVAFD